MSNQYEVLGKAPGPEELKKLVSGDSHVTIKKLSAGYGKMEILHDFDLSVGKAQSLCLIGPNGAGKSTILHSIYGFTNIFSGQIEKAVKIASKLELVTENINYQTILPEIAVSVKNLDFNAANDFSKFLGLEDHDKMLSTILESWYHAVKKQEALSLSSLDRLSEEFSLSSKIDLFSISVQSLFISTYLKLKEETKVKYDLILKNLQKIF